MTEVNKTAVALPFHHRFLPDYPNGITFAPAKRERITNNKALSKGACVVVEYFGKKLKLENY